MGFPLPQLKFPVGAFGFPARAGAGGGIHAEHDSVHRFNTEAASAPRRKAVMKTPFVSGGAKYAINRSRNDAIKVERLDPSR